MNARCLNSVGDRLNCWMCAEGCRAASYKGSGEGDTRAATDVGSPVKALMKRCRRFAVSVMS
jgi:hypothetical protein